MRNKTTQSRTSLPLTTGILFYLHAQICVSHLVPNRHSISDSAQLFFFFASFLFLPSHKKKDTANASRDQYHAHLQ